MNPFLIPVVDVVAKGIAVLLLTMGILSLWRRTSASQRSLVWLLCFGTLLLLPLTMLLQPQWSVEVSGTRAVETATIAPIETVSTSSWEAPAVAPAPIPVVNSAMQAKNPGTPFTMLRMLAFVWSAGAAFVLVGRCVGSLRLRRLKSQTAACRAARVLNLSTSIARELQIHRRVELCTSNAITVPMTWGALRPVVLLPNEALGWSREELDAALRHEMGHIRHWDALTRGLMTVACAIYWFNPLVWIAAKRWRISQEQASDDLVVSDGGNAEAYAMQLLNVARGIQQHGWLKLPAMTMAQPSTLESRLSAIMDEGRNRNSTHRAAVLAGMSATALVLITCASLQLQAAPPPASSSSVTSSQAAGQSVSIDCFVVLCENAEAAQKVAELGLKHSAARTGSRDLARELATLPGVSLHTSGRTYAIAGTLAQVMTNRAVGVGSQAGQGRQVEVPFETVPLITGNGVTLKIKVPMAELRGAQGNAGATVSPGQGSGTEIALKPGGVVALDGGMEKGVSSPRQRVFLVMANVVSADQPEASTGSDESPASSRIIIPTVQFNNATVREVVESLKRMARDHNKTGKVVNILLSPEAADSSAKLTLSLKDVPLSVVLHHVAELTMLEMSVLDDRGGVMFRVPGQPSQAARPRPPPAFPARRGPGTTSASQKAGSIILPSVKFSGATITEAVSYLRSKGAELDADKRGVNILLIDSSKAGKISLDLKDVPLSEALRHVAELGNMELVVEETTFVIRPWRK